jgi:hypothetical protein
MTSPNEYGTYRLSYTPPASTGLEDYPNIAIEMSTDGDASVDQMLRFFEAFLAAAGYVLKGDLQVVEPEEEWKPDPNAIRITSGFDYFGDDGFSFTGNPYAAPDTIGFAGIPGGMGQDILTLG